MLAHIIRLMTIVMLDGSVQGWICEVREMHACVSSRSRYSYSSLSFSYVHRIKDGELWPYFYFPMVPVLGFNT